MEKLKLNEQKLKKVAVSRDRIKAGSAKLQLRLAALGRKQPLVINDSIKEPFDYLN